MSIMERKGMEMGLSSLISTLTILAPILKRKIRKSMKYEKLLQTATIIYHQQMVALKMAPPPNSERTGSF